MKILNDKSRAAIVALVLMITIAATVITIVPVVAQLASSAAFLSVRPDPVGVGQTLLVNAWTAPQPPLLPGGPFMPGRPRTDYMFTFTKPDQTTYTVGPLTSYGEGTTWFEYVPDQTGDWTLKFDWPGDEIFEGSTTTITFTVQQDPVPFWPGAELPGPNDYWERPINKDNREWYIIAGDWLMTSYNNSNSWQGSGGFNPYTTAPNSAHILWTRPSGIGGIIGGDYGSLGYGSGSFGPPIIMGGLLYFNTPKGFACVNIRTGEEIFEVEGTMNIGVPNVGGTPELRSIGGSTYSRYNAYTGELISSISGLEGGYIGWAGWDGQRVYIPVKETMLLCWDPSQVIGGNWTTGIVWNSTVPERTGGHLRMVDDIIVMAGVSEGSIEGGAENIHSRTVAYNATTGDQLWLKERDYVLTTPCCVGYGKLFQQLIETHQIVAFDLKTGDEVWRFDMPYPWGAFGTYTPTTAYGNLYWGAYDGYLRAIDADTGQEVMKYFAGDAGYETPYKTWPFWLGPTVADGKVYGGTSEHSPTQPAPRGNRLHCVDAFTGDPIWSIAGAIGGLAVADGYLVGNNELDATMYCFGKGKTETTVSTEGYVAKGGSTWIGGTVMDMSPAQPGTPCVSEDIMSAWMEYLHMQKPAPPYGTGTGVPVSLIAESSDGTIIDIGETTSACDGYFSIKWTPPDEDFYKITAIFEGDDSYWGSFGISGLTVGPEPTASEPEEASAYTTVDLAIIAAVVVAIVIGLVNLYALRKRA